MQPLLAIAVALLVALVQFSCAAPPPLSLLSTTTNSDDSASTPDGASSADDESTNLGEKFINDTASTTSLPPDVSTDYDLKSKTDAGSFFNNGTVLDDRTGEVLVKIADQIETTPDGQTNFSVSTNKDSVTEFSASSIDAETELSSQSITSTTAGDTEEAKTDEDVSDKLTMSIYVPPLDPMKHMFMMAEVRKQLNISNTETDAETISTANSLVKEEQTTTDKTIIESTDVADKDIEVKNLEPSTTVSSTTVQNKNPDVIRYVDPFESKDILGDNETLPDDQKTTTSIPTTVLDIETTPLLESNDSDSDILHESSILIKSSELFSGRNDSVAAEKLENALESNFSSTESSVTFSTTSSSVATDIPETTMSITTPRETQKEASSDVPSLAREELAFTGESETDYNKETTTKLDETTLETKTSSTEAASFTSVEENSIASTTYSTVEKLLASQSITEKNESFKDVLEFREAELAPIDSKVVYSDTTPKPVDELITTTDVIDSEDLEQTSRKSDSETTTSILTTIKELIFPSTTAPTKPSQKSGDDLELISTSEEERELISESSTENSSELDEKQADSETILKETSPELIKVQLLKSDIDSLSTTSEEFSTTSVEEFESKPVVVDNDLTLETVSDSPNPFTDGLKLNKEILEDVTGHSETSTPLTATSENAPLESMKSTGATAVTISSEFQGVTNSETVEKYSSNTENSKDRYVSGNNSDTVAAVQFLHYHDKASSEQCFKLVDAHWNYATNLTDENKKKQLEQTLEYSLFHKEAWKNATSFAWKSFNDTLLRRWFKSLSVLGTAALPEDKLNEFNRLKAEMKNVYSTAKVCPYSSTEDDKKEKAVQNPGDCNLSLEPDLTRILTKSRDYDELTYVWKAWRDVAGKPIREKYLRFVNLSNEAARLNGFSDNGDMWRESYESKTFETDLEMLWDQLRPLYEHLHAYVRRKLIQQYGNDKIKDDGPIPAHLFGNMWAQSWVSLMDIAQPFPGKPSVDVTPIMEAKNMTALEMFKISEEFFISLGLKEMPEEFWKHSLIEKPKDREIICHASAWDFCNGKDYRIKQCTDITMEDLITVHHEMGHIQYFLQYARQPNVFREGANPGFHEAIGDVLALSVSTPKHLKTIGLLEEVADDPEGDLNFLLFTALDKVSFLPSGYLIDLWRWGLFSGDIKPEEMNSRWWDLRLRYQGICPPVKRHDTDFDPGAKYHVPGNVPYIRYFVSFVIQFQFHKVLCDAAGHTGPLYKCDIYRSKEAGQILSQVMELGSSEHWSEAMKIMTGGATNRMDAGPILEYFHPLLVFLEEQNKNETLGWRSDDSTVCP